MASFGWMISLAFVMVAMPASTSPAQDTSEGSKLCISQGTRFPKFELEGKPPKKSQKGPSDLNLCRIHRRRTCCTRAQTQQALLTLRNLALSGEASPRCMEVWEALECSVCDPRVGTSPGPPVLCDSFCKSLYDACLTARFSILTTRPFQGLLPCGETEYLCPPGKDFSPNSTYFCELAGFKVVDEDETSEFCYDGSVEAESETTVEKDEREPGSQKRRSTGMKARRKTGMELFSRFTEYLLTNDAFWVAGGLVSTVTLLLCRQRRVRDRQRKAAMLRRIHEARSNLEASSPKPRKKQG